MNHRRSSAERNGPVREEATRRGAESAAARNDMTDLSFGPSVSLTRISVSIC